MTVPSIFGGAGVVGRSPVSACLVVSLALHLLLLSQLHPAPRPSTAARPGPAFELVLLPTSMVARATQRPSANPGAMDLLASSEPTSAAARSAPSEAAPEPLQSAQTASVSAGPSQAPPQPQTGNAELLAGETPRQAMAEVPAPGGLGLLPPSSTWAGEALAGTAAHQQSIWLAQRQAVEAQRQVQAMQRRAALGAQAAATLAENLD